MVSMNFCDYASTSISKSMVHVESHSLVEDGWLHLGRGWQAELLNHQQHALQNLFKLDVPSSNYTAAYRETDLFIAKF